MKPKLNGLGYFIGFTCIQLCFYFITRNSPSASSHKPGIRNNTNTCKFTNPNKARNPFNQICTPGPYWMILMWLPVQVVEIQAWQTNSCSHKMASANSYIVLMGLHKSVCWIEIQTYGPADCRCRCACWQCLLRHRGFAGKTWLWQF